MPPGGEYLNEWYRGKTISGEDSSDKVSMDESASLKAELKKWESKFIKDNGRKPSKDDISEADDSIKDKYKKYNNLRRNLKSVDVWGSELNKGMAEKKEAAQTQDRVVKSVSKLGQKLWENAKTLPPSTSKTNGRKQFSLSQTSTKTLSLASSSSANNGNWVRGDTPRPTNVKSRLTLSGPMLPIQEFASPEPKTKLNHNSNFDNSDLIINPKKGSMFEKALQLSHSNPQKKTQVGNEDISDVFTPSSIKPQRMSIPKVKSDFLSQLEDDIKTSIEIELENSVMQSQPFLDVPQPRYKSEKEKSACEKSRTGDSDYSDKNEFDKPFENESTEPFAEDAAANIGDGEENNRGRKRKMSSHHNQADTPSLLLTPSEPTVLSEEINNCDNEDTHTQKRKRRRDKSPLNSVSDNDDSVKSQPDKSWGSIIRDGNRTGPAPNAKEAVNLDKLEDDAGEDHDEDKPKVKKPKAARLGAAKTLGGGGGSSGGKVASQNFVRLNMKTKSYRRRGGGRTGSQMKRLQWKQKMAARSQSRGDKCFKCGGEGHWAKYCKGKRATSAAVEEEDDTTPEDFLTFGDALRMAHGKKPEPKTETVKKNTAKESRDAGKKEAAVDETKVPETEPEDELWAELEIVRQRQSEARTEAAPLPTMKPLFDLTADGKLPETPKAVYKALKTFGYSSFRPGQEAAVLRILCGQTTLVQLATGSGKSLCYQLPALMYAQRSPCVTLVISPLVSLMEDQVSGLPQGLYGACLHTGMTKPQREKVVTALEAGQVHFLLLSPEALLGTGHGLLNFSKMPPIAFACIDEAHCVSAWSHHFRPSYLRVSKVLRERLGVHCLLGLTATATRATALNVAKHLGVVDGENAFIRGKAIPENLVLSVSRDEDRDNALLQLLQGDRFTTCHSIIIYCTRRDTTERLATLIRTNLKDIEHPTKINPKAAKSKSKKVIQSSEAYHAGLSAAARKRVQLNFMNGSLRIVVATVAFGMGLDKQDVHGIIHYNMPRNFESYVQEIGRAGRDGQTSHCHVFLSESCTDLSELKRHIYGNTVDRVTVKKLIQRVFVSCRCSELHEMFQDSMEEEPDQEESKEIVCPWHERSITIDEAVRDLDMKEEGISTLLCYLELDDKCDMEILNPFYATCRLTSYNGLRSLQTASQKCPALAVAIAKVKSSGGKVDGREISFSVVDVADSLGSPSGVVKRELSNLKWVQTAGGGYQRSSLLIEFTDLSFRVRSKGIMSDEEKDDMVDKLHNRIVDQEENELDHLHYFCNVLHSVAHKDLFMCADQADLDRSNRLKDKIRQYFDFNQHHLPKDESLTYLDRMREPVLNDEVICADIRQFIHLYAHEHPLTARAIARIYHGIPSPNFPAEVWGRVRRFWRGHLNVPFNHLLSLCKKTMIRMK